MYSLLLKELISTFNLEKIKKEFQIYLDKFFQNTELWHFDKAEIIIFVLDVAEI